MWNRLSYIDKKSTLFWAKVVGFLQKWAVSWQFRPPFVKFTRVRPTSHPIYLVNMDNLRIQEGPVVFEPLSVYPTSVYTTTMYYYYGMSVKDPTVASIIKNTDLS